MQARDASQPVARDSSTLILQVYVCESRKSVAAVLPAGQLVQHDSYDSILILGPKAMILIRILGLR